MSDVPFMDSSGVHVLIEALRRLEPQNRRLAIVCPDGGQVHRLFAFLPLDGLTVYRSRERAVIGSDDVLRSESAEVSPLFNARTPTGAFRRPPNPPTCWPEPLPARPIPELAQSKVRRPPPGPLRAAVPRAPAQTSRLPFTSRRVR